jgi:pseudouridine-5'-monophosphatase
MPLPGVLELLTTLSKGTTPKMKIALASSAGRTLFDGKTSHIPGLASAFPDSCRVFGDDPDMGDARKKPMPDIFLLALERINALCELRREELVKKEECLVFEDSIAGVEAGRRAGMRVVWVPHEGLAGVCKGREREVLQGRMGIEGTTLDLFMKVEEVGRTGGRVRTEDGWAEMLRSLEVFPYDEYGIRLVGEKE